MSFIDVMMAKVVPHDCLGCGREGNLLCPACLGALPPVPETCYRCHQPSMGSLMCSSCLVDSYLQGLKAATIYTGAAKKLIWKLKSTGAQSAAIVMAEAMAGLIKNKEAIIIAVPTATTRVRQRGYDQTKLLARNLAKQTKLLWVDCLARSGQAHQVGSGREQRREQLANVLRVTQKRFIKDTHVILIDDVVTTGATLEAAARILKDAGAMHVEAITFARAIPRNPSRIKPGPTSNP